MWNDILAQLESLDGRTGFYYENLVTGEVVEHHAQEAFRAASVMKLPILIAMLALRERGELDFSQRVHLYEQDKLPSCGALKHITGEGDFDLETLYKLMITISDSTATNLLIDHLTPEVIGEELRRLGAQVTQVNRKFYDDVKEGQGIQNYFSPREIGHFLKGIYHKTLISESASSCLLEVLLQQQINHKIPGYLPAEIMVAHKTGEEDIRTHDVGIVFAKEPFVVCFASDEIDIPAFERFIRETSLRLVQSQD